MRAVDTSKPWTRLKVSITFAVGSVDNPLTILMTMTKTGRRLWPEKSDRTYGKRLITTLPTKELTKLAK